ncbi:MAG TPA: holo-[acyl-carrier-protein] synthase [Chloroflexi bacterium]|nr:holo-[acyl-carrier-protein] synthase [Chloroflexota bacterium]HBY08158.1 holo-[acyl-carrier-protein] synthase [Chloroflexota bacterium]
MKLATGVDILEIERVAGVVERQGARFKQRFFTPGELADAGENIASLAARFAAKEAISKALGTGMGRVPLTDMEVLRDEQRAPQVHLHGEALRVAQSLGLHTWSISLSHSEAYAVAFVVAMGDGPD